MTRIVLSLDEDDRRWLEEKAAKEGIALTEIIRRTIKRIRSEEPEADWFSQHVADVQKNLTGIIRDRKNGPRIIRELWIEYQNRYPHGRKVEFFRAICPEIPEHKDDMPDGRKGYLHNDRFQALTYVLKKSRHSAQVA